MEERDADAGLARDRQQFDLRALETPSRRGQAAVLGTVGIAEHHDLPVATAAQVFAIRIVREQRAHHLRRDGEVLHGLEQRRHVDRHRGRGIDAAGRTCQRDHAEHVRGTAAHADDVRPDGGGAEARPDLGQGAKHRQGAGCVLRNRLRHLPRGRQPVTQRLQPLAGFARLPLRIAEQLAERQVVHGRVLANVERRQVEAEGMHAPEQASHGKGASVFAAVTAKALLDRSEIVEQRAGLQVAALLVLRGPAQPFRHQAEQFAIRHVGMSAFRHWRIGKLCAAVRDAGVDRRIEVGAAACLAQQRGELAQVTPVGTQQQATQGRMRGGDRVGPDIGIAIHVAADPGREAQGIVRQRGGIQAAGGERLGKGFVIRR